MSIRPTSATGGKFAELNALRVARGQEPLKVWKGSIAALEQTIVAYKTHKVEPAVAEGAYPNARVAEHATGLKGTDEKKRQAIKAANEPKAKPASAASKRALDQHLNVPATETSTKETTMSKKQKPAIKRAAEPKGTGAALVKLADIARQLKIEPKLARAKARRNDDLTKLAQGDSWAFKPADVEKVKKILKGE